MSEEQKRDPEIGSFEDLAKALDIKQGILIGLKIVNGEERIILFKSQSMSPLESVGLLEFGKATVFKASTTKPETQS